MTEKARTALKEDFATALPTGGSITAATLVEQLGHMADSAILSEDLIAAIDAEIGSTDWQLGGVIGGAAWGDITGTLANQTDLQAALDAKADAAALVSSDANNTLTGPPKFWVGSQADYDALGTYDADTIYDIVS